MIIVISFLTFKPLLTGKVILDTKIDLKNYPNMLVEDGIFNGMLVVGENAKSEDVLAITDIASNMKVREVPFETGIAGDAWKVESGNNVLEMANSDRSEGLIQGENLYDISRYIGKNELRALNAGVYRTKSNSYPYNQYLYFDVANTATNELVKYSEDDNDYSDIFFFVQNGRNIGQYRLEFVSTAKSDIYDTSGTVSTSGTVLRDFEDSMMNMFGNEYIIVLARRPQSTPKNSIQLTLMGGTVKGNLLEGESETYLLGNNSYNVNLAYVDNTHVKFNVNGEDTSKLRAGEVYKLSDGRDIGVIDNLYQNYAGGVHSANFFIGADKLVLRDDDVTNSVSDNKLEIDGTTINGADVIITGSDDNTVFILSTISVNMTAEDDYYVGKNQKLSEVISLTEDDPKILFTNNWDMEFKGLSELPSHEIKLSSSSDRKYDLVFYDGNNNKVELPLFYAVNDTSISFGEEPDSKCLFLTESLGISKNDYLVVTGGDANTGSAKSFALQYKGADSSTDTSPKIKFKDLGSKKNLEYSIDTSSTASGSSVAEIKLGGYTFPVISNEATTSKDFQIRVSLDGGTTPGTDNIEVVDSYGAKISVGSIPTIGDCRNTTVDSSTVTINTADASDYNDQAPSEIVLTADATTGSKVTISSFTIGGTSNPLSSQDNIAYGYTSMGGRITYFSPSGSPNTFIYDYPKEQKSPKVYITSKVETSSAGKLIPVMVVDASSLDSEVSGVDDNNLIVIGGPCVNKIAADLLGNPSDCTQGFTPGKAMIKLFENNGKTAVLVAGYGKDETRLAGKVLAYRWGELSGKEIEVSGKSYADALITRVN